VPRGDRRRRIPELLERLGLSDRAREPIARFSKGMAQRLGVAQALINDPDLLVLDEPNEGLDLAGRHLVADLLRDRARSGRSALLISHVTSDAGGLCDRIAVLTTGRLAYLGPPSALVTGPGRTLEQALTQLYEGAVA
jgi:ABC-2 type transport system ATP-binding protein